MTTALKPICLAAASACALAACSGPLDFDLRGDAGGSFDTTNAAKSASASRPEPDSRGIISYPDYQVAVARRGDTLATLAARIGANAAKLARYNGIRVDDRLRQGEVVALPERVGEAPAKGGGVDIAGIAGRAIDSAESPEVKTAALPSSDASQSGQTPTQHVVERGETAFTIARLYNVSVRTLAEWNGLDSDFSVHEGQRLLIPTSHKPPAPKETSKPGEGSPTPTPPSASKPLPKDEATPASKPVKTPPAPDLGAQQSKPKASSSAQLAYPVQGSIIREYSKGKNDGIDIAASAGTPVGAAASGTVAAITSDADQVPIIILRHKDNLLTVYANVGNIVVDKGDKITRGQSIASVRSASPSYLHFEVRKGFESVDPMPYLTE